MRGVRSKFAAAAKVVSFAGNEVIGKSVACVEMRGERLIVGIYRDKHALTLKSRWRTHCLLVRTGILMSP